MSASELSVGGPQCDPASSMVRPWAQTGTGGDLTEADIVIRDGNRRAPRQGQTRAAVLDSRVTDFGPENGIMRSNGMTMVVTRASLDRVVRVG